MIDFFSGSSCKKIDLDVQPLEFMSGVIWTSLNIDYPGHSFSHLGVFHGK